ncbi:Uncharacterised protein (plasmid) [Tsukamurella tyrosinosolvens]|uniref:Uncharacterized protein n=1 Tax=Tsukamurella tyrosinosolvens TaxID=57704 RepID=A0A1H4V2B2_TSUTY|nr:hypothetical protein [Tsukamurella tyrosinosolvens]KXO91081.1 hypothetical protein AXK58_21870 [Tsukamurella tyrosinosolvens]SEC74671.1 hypothetical protein SAMN04489793_3105 [Tsukamurella tyrosinosolvens]VEH90751.1 Uncharacterised protein [Tsukamurella tyrosinosolvens]
MMSLYAGMDAAAVRELIESRLSEERAHLGTARAAVASAYSELTVAGLVEGTAGRFYDHDSPDSPRQLRQEAQRRQQIVAELTLMLEALRSGDPAVALSLFASQTTNPLLAADAEALATALSHAA